MNAAFKNMITSINGQNYYAESVGLSESVSIEYFSAMGTKNYSAFPTSKPEGSIDIDFYITTGEELNVIESGYAVTGFSSITDTINLETVNTRVQSSVDSQIDIPIIELGALVFYSGNIFIDLILNFAFAIPEMIAILVNGIFLLFSLDSQVWAVVQLFASVAMGVVYLIGVLALLVNVRSRGTDIMEWWIGLQLLEDNLLMSVENIILLIVVVSNMAFIAKDFKLGMITQLLFSSMLFILYYVNGWNYAPPVVVMFITLVILSLDLYFVSQAAQRGAII